MRKYYLIILSILFLGCNNEKYHFESIEVFGSNKYHNKINDKDIINKFSNALSSSKVNSDYLKFKTKYTVKGYLENDTLTFYISNKLFTINKKSYISSKSLYDILELNE